MTDKQSNTAFDDKVKDVLKNYETSNASANWARMESMLNSAPQAHSFKKIDTKIVLKIVAAAAVVATSYLIYSVIASQPSTEQKVNEETNKATEQTQTEQPEEIKQEPTPIVEQVPENTTEPTQQTETAVINPENKEKTATANTIKVEKTKPNNLSKETDESKPKKIMTMGNEPVFGDMLDSSKGIVGKTQEKEEIKKAAKEQTKAKTGWNDFLFSPVAPDSILKNREKEQADSLKKR